MVNQAQVFPSVTRRMSGGSDERLGIPGGLLGEAMGMEEDNKRGASDVGDNLGEHRPSQSQAVEAGPYYLGPVVKRYVRSPVTQCLARKKGTDDYYLMKILILKDGPLKDKFQLYRRAVFHTEYTILGLLKGHPGVIQLHDFFKDFVPEHPSSEPAGKSLKRMCMVLECLIPHGRHNAELIPLPDYLTEKRRLSEAEALRIFVHILSVINDLHKANVVHKDLRLFNIILNRRSLRVKLINFYHARLLSPESELSHNQRCNPSYAPPDLIAGKPVSPKPCDMWSAGVILYMMLHGYLPFNGSPSWGSALANTRALADLYSKIITNDCVISDEITVSDGTKQLIRSLLCKDPHARLKSDEALDMACTVLALQSSSQTRSFPGSNTSNSVSSDVNSQYSDQIVPECPTFNEKPNSSPSSCTECWLIVNANAPHVPSKTYKIAISEVDSSAGKAKRTSVRGKASEAKEDAATMSSEKELLSRRCRSNASRRSSMSRSSKIKFAMLRLGATSMSKISALSFSYGERRSGGSRSNM